MVTQKALRCIPLALLVLGACHSPAHDVYPRLTQVGTMRAVMKLGQDEGRLSLSDLGAPGAIGVGALAGLAGEVTIVDERVLVSKMGQLEEDAHNHAATLLLYTVVPAWQEHPLPDCTSYAELDAAIAARLQEQGFDLRTPIPIRIEGRGDHVEYHVIDGACPIASPSGPPPWRHTGPLQAITLVGFFARDAAGVVTHHTSESHLHCVALNHTGHLDEVALSQATLWIPDRTPE